MPGVGQGHGNAMAPLTQYNHGQDNHGTIKGLKPYTLGRFCDTQYNHRHDDHQLHCQEILDTVLREPL